MSDIRVFNAFSAAALTLIVGVLPFLWRRDRLTLVFALSNVALVLWNLGEAVVFLPATHSTQLHVYRASYVAGVFTVWLFYRFACVFTRSEAGYLRGVWRTLLVFGGILILASFSPLFIQDIDTTTHPLEIPGPAYPLFIVFLASGGGFMLHQLLRGYRFSSGVNRTRYKYIFVALASILIAAGIFFLSLYVRRFPTYHFYLQAVYASIVAYAILKHQLLSIHVAVRRTGLILMIYTLLLAVSTPFLLMVYEVMGSGRPGEFMFVGIGVVALILSFGPGLYRFFVDRSAFFHEQTLAGLAHELKSPLAAIESALELLTAQVAQDPKNPKQAEYLDMIDRNSARLRGFIEDLLIVMRVGADKSYLAIENTDLTALCASILQRLNVSKNADVDIVMEGATVGCTLSCDPGRIAQVVSNLLSNAIKFTHKGRVSVFISEGEAKAIVTVADTGTGISRGELPFVFDRYFQGQAGREAGGTGIGLAVAKTWVEAHGGEINVESDGEGKGSRFWFTLPK